MLGCVHKKVFPVICERFRSEDSDLLLKCSALSGILPDQLGVKTDFSCPLPSAVSLWGVFFYTLFDEKMSTFFSNIIGLPERRNKRKSVLEITKIYYFKI